MFEERHIGVIADTLYYDLESGLSKSDFRLVSERIAIMLQCHSKDFDRTEFLDRCSVGMKPKD